MIHPHACQIPPTLSHDKRVFRIDLRIWIWLLCILWLASPAAAHEWPDGVVDRSIQLDIWPDHVEMLIGVGMSHWTVSQLLEDRVSSPAEIAETPQARIEQLREILLVEFANDLQLEIAGQAIELTPVSSELSSKHHVLFFLTIRGEYEMSTEPREVELVDAMFTNWKNQMRLAIRPRQTEMFEANVEPLIVRAERLELWKLAEDDAQAARRMHAYAALPGGPGIAAIKAQARQEKIAAAKAVNADELESDPPEADPNSARIETSENKSAQTEALSFNDETSSGHALSLASQDEPESPFRVGFVQWMLTGIALLLVAAGAFSWWRTRQHDASADKN